MLYIFRRALGCAMDSLKFACSWSGGVNGAKQPIKVGGLMLEGCTFDGSRLSENQRDSPIVSSIPKCVMAWIPKVNPTLYTSFILLFIYLLFFTCEGLLYRPCNLWKIKVHVDNALRNEIVCYHFAKGKCLKLVNPPKSVNQCTNQ